MKSNKKSLNKVVASFELIGKLVTRFKWLVVIFWVVATILIVHYLPSLSSVTTSNNSDFLPASSQSEKAIKLANVFGKSNVGPSIPVAILSKNGPITSNQNQNYINALITNLKKTKSVIKVDNAGISKDNQAEELIVISSSNYSGTGVGVVTSLRTAIKNTNLPPSIEAHLAGDIAVNADISKSSGHTDSNLQLYSVLFIVILLLLIFRAPLAPIITLIPAFIVVTISGPIIAEAANHGLKVSSLAQLLLTVLVLGAGTDYGLFLIFRVREELKNGLEKNEAIIRALGRVGESITFSALTVIAALLSLLIATFELYSNLGVPLAIGIGIMLIAGLTLLPALISIFGRAVFWPSLKSHKNQGQGIWGRLSSSVVKRPALVLSVGVIFFIALALGIPGYKAGGFGGNTTPPAGSDSALGNQILNDHFPKSNSNPTEIVFVFKNSIYKNIGVVNSLESGLLNSKQFNSVTGPLNPNGFKMTPSLFNSLYQKFGAPNKLSTAKIANISSPKTLKLLELYKLEANFISPDGKTVLFATSLISGDPSTTTAMNDVPAIRSAVSKVASENGAINNGVVGEAPALYDINSISQSDLYKVIPVAIVVIGLLLAVLIRSLVAPLYLIISVALSYLASLGLAVLLFIDIQKVSGIVFILPFLMFLFLLALGEDYNILVMTRIREETHHLPLKKAVPKALITTGTTVTSAGLVLAGTFAVFAIVGGAGPGGSEFQDIGFGLAAGIILDTFIVRTLLVPSVVLLLGRFNWWPSKHGSWIDQN